VIVEYISQFRRWRIKCNLWDINLKTLCTSLT